ncbi:nitrilase-related carbon-nitrogen hydrolase [Arthrobacter castelli]|uniref:nitrilase-related carbon-nitrogen hydrolase n=1 Tax=Arthrobacter castelli TaxID=271431 RepID=UPI000403046C|nr:nitrilase-related carbon-nitrogen hydrolase [Arthrobacter castelli]
MALIGVWQATGAVDRVQENLARLDQTAVAAAGKGADILVTPELFATGYAPSRAASSDGDTIRERLAETASRHHMALVASTVDHDGEETYISASFFDAEGKELTRYRKSQLFGLEEKSAFTPGTNAPELIQYAGLRLALGICYDVEFPEFVRAAARRGVDALLIPTAVPATGNVGGLPADRTYNAERISTLMVPCRAMENGLYIAYANHTVPNFTGLSCISGPHGNVLAQAGHDEELLLADIEALEVERARRINTYLNDLREDLEGSATVSDGRA